MKTLHPDALTYAANMITLANLYSVYGPEIFYKLIEMARTSPVEKIAEFLVSEEVQQAIIARTSDVAEAMARAIAGAEADPDQTPVFGTPTLNS